MRDMHWFVYVEDFNGRRIGGYDIGGHHSFAEDVRKAYRKHRTDFDAFSSTVGASLMYWFWSKCEWEVIVSAWPPTDRVPARKVDVFEQVMLNWDVFVRYVWHQAHARKAGE